MNNNWFSVSLILVAMFGLALQACVQTEPAREITNVTGDLYRVTDTAHRTVFLVTSEGIILADPISHHHDDHASGAAAFADTATLVGHENMIPNLAREADNPIFQDVRSPDVTFTDRISVTLGGKTVEMIHALPSHSDDSAIIRFPGERTIFAVDFVNVGRVPFENFGGGPVAPWIEANKHLQATVNYDIVVPGHGPVGTPADVDDSTRYLEVLLADVTEGIEAGLTLEELQETVLMEDFSHYLQYDVWREQNVQGAYQGLMGE
jgi:glyoxylase-like metal-dependent hydrolase (beta-lactamase superfamily II)